jgi:very-short-patch-repair endonuclease
MLRNKNVLQNLWWARGKQHPNKGKHWSEKIRRKISETKKLKGQFPPIHTRWKKGQHPSPETEFKKGQTPWNKGKPYYQIRGKKHPMYGKHHSEESRRKMSASLKGRKVWNKGKSWSVEVRKKISETKKRLYTERKLKVWSQGLTKETDERVRKLGLKSSKTKKERQTMKKLWQNPGYREKMIKSALKGLVKRPTSLEKHFLMICKKHNLPFKYVGDGSLLIGFKNPDFVECNGKKICIEVANRYFQYHKPNEVYKQKRIEHFAKFGWKCLVFFEDDLKNEEKIVQKIKEVMS